MVRDDLIASIAQAEDAAFIRDGTGNAPKGLRYWAGNTPTMTGTPDIAKITTDLAILETYLLSANVHDDARLDYGPAGRQLSGVIA